PDGAKSPGCAPRRATRSMRSTPSRRRSTTASTSSGSKASISGSAPPARTERSERAAGGPAWPRRISRAAAPRREPAGNGLALLHAERAVGIDDRGAVGAAVVVALEVDGGLARVVGLEPAERAGPGTVGQAHRVALAGEAAAALLRAVGAAGRQLEEAHQARPVLVGRDVAGGDPADPFAVAAQQPRGRQRARGGRRRRRGAPAQRAGEAARDARPAVEVAAHVAGPETLAVALAAELEAVAAFLALENAAAVFHERRAGAHRHRHRLAAELDRERARDLAVGERAARLPGALRLAVVERALAGEIPGIGRERRGGERRGQRERDERERPRGETASDVHECDPLYSRGF